MPQARERSEADGDTSKGHKSCLLPLDKLDSLSMKNNNDRDFNTLHFLKKNHKSLVILKKRRYEERMAFFTEECQLLNIEEMMELKNHPFQETYGYQRGKQGGGAGQDKLGACD